MNELETLMRDTMRARAETIADAPTWDGTTSRPERRWLPVAAAVILVLAVGGATTALWRANDSGSNPGATSVTATVGSCAASLPSAWRTALQHQSVLAPGGAVAVPVAITPDARTIVVWKHNGRSWFGVLAAEGRAVHPLYQEPSGREVETVDVDSTTLVFGEIDRARASYGGPITAVVTVDLSTGQAATILRPVPGQTLAGTTSTSVFIQDGIIYWSLVRTGVPGPATIVAYTVRTGVSRVIGHTPSHDPTLTRDVRGVEWDGGSVASTVAVPEAAAADGTLDSDGRTFAWQPDSQDVRGNPQSGQLLTWADGQGDTRTIHISQLRNPQIELVGGPFVLLAPTITRPLADGEPFTMQLLDVRTGAVAPITVPFGAQFAATGHWAFTTRTGILLMNTNALPGLHC